MWKIKIPDITDSEKNLSLAFTNSKKNEEPVSSTITTILELYSAYDEVGGIPSETLLGTSLGSTTLDRIHRAYDLVRSTGRLKHLKNRLKLSRSKCPYCGFGEASTLDHYLPRSRYKAHSIYARNLIPCCQTCNRKKDKIAGTDPDTQFVHAYFFPQFKLQFLFATVQIIEKSIVVDFEIKKNIEISDEDFRRAKFQLEQLDLNNRYIPEIITFMLSNKRDIESLGSIGKSVLKDHFIQSHADSCTLFGVNHWRTALWLALAESDDFCGGGFAQILSEMTYRE
ncbi:HNH endonuclease signature motif containing protein [uncultured Pseudomonas sp.]|uniref:HNH endonuclease n=1 Tax=uncultured Pseudomonas sp. TaxID=114707 RepID=UPI0025D7FF31|nr:HNH endonuclease signature motif containing protein [uncultured Pseudomonas sp.]